MKSNAGRPTRQGLGEILLTEGLLAQKQLDIALREQRRSGERLEKILVNLGFVAEEVIAQLSSERFGVPFINLDSQVLTSETVKLVPENIARKQQLVCFARDGGMLSVAMVDPLNVFAIDDIERSTGLRVKPFVGTVSAVKKTQDDFYGISETVDELLNKIDEKSLQIIQGEEVQVDRLRRVAVETPIVMLVNLMLAKAIRENASDIHFEPQADSLRIRMRIDGILYEDSALPPKLHPAVASRLKIMGEMDIGERRVPQDGHVSLTVENKEIDLRLSTLPTVYGEKIVVRILDKRKFLLGMDDLGFPAHLSAIFPKLLDRPQGLILVTGPTGSGKTTTLYAALQRINVPARNVVTVEDPVEYKIPGINQMQINIKAGITFAKGLRGILRQDPNVIMVGEIRDFETAEIAIRAALTGQLVISTMHTNDAAGSIDRLVDMGCERYLISSALVGIVAQRLVRTVCPKCRKAVEPDPALLKELQCAPGPQAAFCQGSGCSECRGSGYKGRVGIFEILEASGDIRKMIVERKNTREIRLAARRAGMESIREHGFRKAAQGVTTISEVMRVFGGED